MNDLDGYQIKAFYSIYNLLIMGLIKGKNEHLIVNTLKISDKNLHSMKTLSLNINVGDFVEYLYIKSDTNTNCNKILKSTIYENFRFKIDILQTIMETFKDLTTLFCLLFLDTKTNNFFKNMFEFRKLNTDLLDSATKTLLINIIFTQICETFNNKIVVINELNDLFINKSYNNYIYFKT